MRLHSRQQIMYRLTIFILISCTISEQLVAAVRKRASPFSRRKLYFTPYGYESMEGTGDAVGEEIFFEPERAADVLPSISWLHNNTFRPINESSVIGDVDNSYEDSDDKRSILIDFISKVGEYLGLNSPPHNISSKDVLMKFTYQLDDSLGPAHSKMIGALLMNVTENTCTESMETNESPDIIFMGAPGCLFRLIDNRIIIGQDCFDSRIITKLIFEVLKFCKIPIPLSILNPHKQLRESEFEPDCFDKLQNCSLLAENNGCVSFFQILVPVCPRTCRVCGAKCVDYGPNCTVDDALTECLRDWDQKKYSCADTCGLCRMSETDDLEPCVDRFNECEEMAKLGYCEKLPVEMREFCPKSCNFCKIVECLNRRDDCSALASHGACEKIPRLMRENCPESCGFCQNIRKNNIFETMFPKRKHIPNIHYILEHCFWDKY